MFRLVRNIARSTTARGRMMNQLDGATVRTKDVYAGLSEGIGNVMAKPDMKAAAVKAGEEIGAAQVTALKEQALGKITSAAERAQKNIFARHPILTAAGIGGAGYVALKSMQGPSQDDVAIANMQGEAMGRNAFEQQVMAPMMTANMGVAGYEGRMQGPALGQGIGG